MSLARLGALSCLAWLGFALGAQEPGSRTKIDEAWDALLPAASPALQSAAQPAGSDSDFLKHFFFESRTEFWRYSTSFTGLPTITGVINAPFTGVFNPSGIPYPAAFQPDANRLYSFLDWGTRGWLSDRVDTHFAARYEQDISHVGAASPAESPLETFPGNRRVDLVNATLEIHDARGWSIALGRQYVYGAEIAPIDGGAFSIDRGMVGLTVFGGRRFTFFGDPDQRAIGGANATLRLGRDASIQLQTLWYINGENAIAYRRRFGADWLFSTYFRTYGGAPVDLNAQGFYAGSNGRTMLRLGFYARLTNRDYIYDYTIAARDLATFNVDPRLYLGLISPHTQFMIEADRAITPLVRLGAAVSVRRLTNNNDQNAFDTSFQDYRAHANLFPLRKVTTSFEYHQHDSDRLSPANTVLFDDVSRSGETSVKDLTGEISRAFHEGRFSLNGGAYYRRIGMQDRFYTLSGLHQAGWLAGGWWRLDQRTRLYGDYDLDNDFFLFYPSIRNSRALRLGIDWKY